MEAFLNDTLKAMDMDVEIVSEVDSEGALSVEMKGSNMGILIGKRGQTLDALQYLANRVANKHQEMCIRDRCIVFRVCRSVTQFDPHVRNQ